MKHDIAPAGLYYRAAVLVVAVASAHVAKARDTDWIGPATGGNWNTPASWQNFDAGGVAIPGFHLPPSAAFNEAAEINTATVILNTQTMSAANPGDPLMPVDVAGLRLGELAAESGGVEIRNGGILRNIPGNRPTVNEPEETGAIQVGIAGRGTLTVLGGGQLTGTSFTSAGTNNTSVTFGDTSGATATITINSVATQTMGQTTGAANFGRITTVVGPNVNFNAAGNLTLGNTGTLIADIRSATAHSALRADGNATLGGTLKPMFTGFTPAAGNRWRMVDVAGTVSGNFSLDTSMVSLPTGLALTTVPGTNGARNTRDLLVEEVLVLQVNRGTGAVSIANIGAANKTIDGYSILSPFGWLTGTWNSLDDQNVGGDGAWVEAGPTPNALSELNPAQVPPGSTTINAGTSLQLGTPYVVNTAMFPPLGTDPDNLMFEYSGPDGRTLQGHVVYSGTRIVNNMILTVDPATGAVAFKNDSPYTLTIDGYNIASDSGSLASANWNSLDDQNVAGWDEAPPAPSDNEVAELKADGALTLPPGTGFSLGNLFKTGATQDLQFGFLQIGNETPTLGTVVYGPFTPPPPPTGGVTGDYNNNGVVDAADYVLWRNGGPLMNDPTPGIQPGDYNVWRTNFGRTATPGIAAATAVPEPSTFVLICLVAAAPIVCARSRKR
jgi:hypothetical protein